MYFGLAGGFNARARAANFEDGELAEVMAYLRERGVKGFVTLNVLARSRPPGLMHGASVLLPNGVP